MSGNAKKNPALAPVENMIRVVRGQKVMLDSDIAHLYGVETKMLNRAVKRNPSRFPDDLMFQLTSDELDNLRCQFGTSSSGYGGRRYLPYVFTEHGVVMLSAVLNSPRAVQMSLLVVRAFAAQTSDRFCFFARGEEMSRRHCLNQHIATTDAPFGSINLSRRVMPDLIRVERQLFKCSSCSSTPSPRLRGIRVFLSRGRAMMDAGSEPGMTRRDGFINSKRSQLKYQARHEIRVNL